MALDDLDRLLAELDGIEDPRGPLPRQSVRSQMNLAELDRLVEDFEQAKIGTPETKATPASPKPQPIMQPATPTTPKQSTKPVAKSEPEKFESSNYTWRQEARAAQATAAQQPTNSTPSKQTSSTATQPTSSAPAASPVVKSPSSSSTPSPIVKSPSSSSTPSPIVKSPSSSSTPSPIVKSPSSSSTPSSTEKPPATSSAPAASPIVKSPSSSSTPAASSPLVKSPSSSAPTTSTSTPISSSPPASEAPLTKSPSSSSSSSPAAPISPPQTQPTGGSGIASKDSTKKDLRHSKRVSVFALKPINRDDVCASCGYNVKGEHVVALGKIFHTNHFTCSSCGLGLSNDFFEQDGKPSCGPCMEKYYTCMKCGKGIEAEFFEVDGLKFHGGCLDRGSCARCGKGISSTETSALGKTYHPECFTCHGCGSKLDGTFFAKNNEPFCPRCASSKAPVPQGGLVACAICRQQVFGNYVTFNNENYHSHCFTCSKCRQPLPIDSFYMIKGQFHCESCAKS